MTRLSGVLTLIIGVVVVWASSIAGPDAQTTAPSVQWEQSQSVSIRLGVKGHEWQMDVAEAECFVEGLMPHGIRSTRQVAIKRDRQQYLYFPEDFQRKPFPGEYRWGCTLGGRTIAQGGFEYTTPDQARVIR
jgi:hypothetical protein